MKAAVAYEASRRQKPQVRALKWHVADPRFGYKEGGYETVGQKRHYYIKRQKPNRRLGIFRWGLFENAGVGPDDVAWQPVAVNGKPMSLDDLGELKAFASSYDAIPAGTVIEVNEAPGAAKEACSTCGGHANEASNYKPLIWTEVARKSWPKPDPGFRAPVWLRVDKAEGRKNTYAIAERKDAVRFQNGGGRFELRTVYEDNSTMLWDILPSRDTAMVAASRLDHHGLELGEEARESPTREEWEVIVTNPPATHRGAILAMGLGETSEVGNKIVLRGFHDDEQAGRVASSIARTYKVQVTFGPCNVLYNAAEEASYKRLTWHQKGESQFVARTRQGVTYYVIRSAEGGWLVTREAHSGAAPVVIGDATNVRGAQGLAETDAGPSAHEANEAPRGHHGFDEHAATELELYADNTAELYNQKSSIIENMRRRLAKGTYDPELGKKLWMYWVDAAAKRYAKEFGGTWNNLFGTGTRLEVARREEERERAELQIRPLA